MKENWDTLHRLVFPLKVVWFMGSPLPSLWTLRVTSWGRSAVPPTSSTLQVWAQLLWTPSDLTRIPPHPGGQPWIARALLSPFQAEPTGAPSLLGNANLSWPQGHGDSVSAAPVLTERRDSYSYSFLSNNGNILLYVLLVQIIPPGQTQSTSGFCLDCILSVCFHRKEKRVRKKHILNGPYLPDFCGLV